MADSDDLSDKMKELGVEEKANETNWNHMPFEVKEMIVKEMDIETRARLKMCSKSDKYLVESTRMSYHRLHVWVCEDEDEERRRNMIVSVSLRRNESKSEDTDLSDSDDTDLFLQLIANGNIVSIRKSPNEPRQIQCSSEEEAKNMVKQMFFNIFLAANFRFEKVEAWIDYPGFIDNSEFTIHAKDIDIHSSSSQVIQWLNNVTPGVKTLTKVTSYPDTVEGLGNIPAVINAKLCYIHCNNDINDEQLLNFSGTTLEISGESNITAKGINQLIKKAISNDYPKESMLFIPINPELFRQCWNEIIDGLDIQVTDFQDDFDEDRCMIYRGQIKMKDGKRMEVCLSGRQQEYKEFEAEVL